MHSQVVQHDVGHSDVCENVLIQSLSKLDEFLLTFAFGRVDVDFAGAASKTAPRFISPIRLYSCSTQNRIAGSLHRYCPFEATKRRRSAGSPSSETFFCSIFSSFARSSSNSPYSFAFPHLGR